MAAVAVTLAQEVVQVARPADEVLVSLTQSVVQVVQAADEVLVSLIQQPVEIRVVTESVRVSSIQQPVAVELAGVGLRGPKGETGSDGHDGAGTTYTATNKHGSALPAGSVVAVHSTGVGFVAADATSEARPAVGLLLAGTDDEAAGTIQSGGPFELADWTDITGAVELAAKATYFLDVVAGKLVATTPPSGAGNVVQAVGTAVSPTMLKIEIDETTLI